jgi:hypothetical protein
MTYSGEGAQIASDAYDRASKEPLADGANKVLWNGYNRILSSPATTDDEKAIARFGDAVSRVTMDLVEHNRVAFPLIKSLAWPVNGPVGHVLGKIIYDTANNVKLAKTANEVLWKSYDAIIDNPRTTDDEKAIARLGRKVSHITLDLVEHNRVAFPLVKAISTGVQGATGNVIAGAAYNSALNVSYAETANRIFWSAYGELLGNPNVADPEEVRRRSRRRHFPSFASPHGAQQGIVPSLQDNERADYDAGPADPRVCGRGGGAEHLQLRDVGSCHARRLQRDPEAPRLLPDTEAFRAHGPGHRQQAEPLPRRCEYSSLHLDGQYSEEP